MPATLSETRCFRKWKIHEIEISKIHKIHEIKIF